MGVPVGVNRLQTHLVAFVCINYAYANLVVDGVTSGEATWEAMLSKQVKYVAIRWIKTSYLLKTDVECQFVVYFLH